MIQWWPLTDNNRVFMTWGRPHSLSVPDVGCEEMPCFFPVSFFFFLEALFKIWVDKFPRDILGCLTCFDCGERVTELCCSITIGTDNTST